MYTSVTESCFSTYSTSTWTHGLKYSNLSLVVYVLGGCSTGSVDNRKKLFPSQIFKLFYRQQRFSDGKECDTMVLDILHISSSKCLLPIWSQDEMRELKQTENLFTDCELGRCKNHLNILIHSGIIHKGISIQSPCLPITLLISKLTAYSHNNKLLK